MCFAAFHSSQTWDVLRRGMRAEGRIHNFSPYVIKVYQMRRLEVTLETSKTEFGT